MNCTKKTRKFSIKNRPQKSRRKQSQGFQQEGTVLLYVTFVW